jgi:hypothetical protein
MAPDMPDLTLPTEEEVAQTSASKPAQKKQVARQNTSKSTSRKSTASREEVIAVTNASISGKKDEYVEKVTPDLSQLTPLPETSSVEQATADTTDTDFVPARETSASGEQKGAAKVRYKPSSERDPMLSPDDRLLLEHKKKEARRLAALERKRQEEAERRRIAELERQRQWELERLRDPSREIRGKIRINGIIGQEVFIGNKVYTVGKTVLGARIVSVQPDRVVFLYKGQRFTKKIQLQ